MLCSCSNMKRTIQILGSVMVRSCKGNSCFHDGRIHAHMYIKALEEHVLPLRKHLFQGYLWIFQWDDIKPHFEHITNRWMQWFLHFIYIFLGWGYWTHAIIIGHFFLVNLENKHFEISHKHNNYVHVFFSIGSLFTSKLYTLWAHTTEAVL